MKNILLLAGGGSTEHEISLISAQYIESKIDKEKYKVFKVIIDKDFTWKFENQICELSNKKELRLSDRIIKIDCAIPCIHGFPGETGDIQSFFEVIKLPYFGCNSEANVLCFNKLATKLWLEFHGIITTPFTSIQNLSEKEMDKAESFFKKHKIIYIKATNQGSSVGCYRVDNIDDLKQSMAEAFKFSPFVILEKEIIGRELEVAVFEFKDEIIATSPGEIICPNKFYTYEEKYNSNSNTKTNVVAENISTEVSQKMKEIALSAFQSLKLRHISRIDFFLTTENEILINEINTMPGHTGISMFPMMMENYGVNYSDFINGHLSTLS